MKEKFESFPNNYEKLALLQELAATLGVKTRDALYDVEDIEEISFQANEDGATLAERDDAIIVEVVVLYTETLALVRQRLMEWFGVVGYHKVTLIDEETGHFIAVINEHDKPEGWDSQSDMPTTFTIRFTSSFDKWVQSQNTVK